MIVARQEPSLPDPGASERRRTLDFAWPVVLCVVTVFALAADYLGLPAGDVATLLEAVFLIGITYLSAVLIGRRLAAAAPADALLWVSPLAITFALALLWHYSGTLSNPAFTVFMAVPVLLAGVASPRWLPYAVALAATAALIATALIAHPEARWFIERWGLRWPTALTTDSLTGGGLRVESSVLAARPDAFFATFAGGMLATALLASAIGSLLERYREYCRQAVALGEESRLLADRLLSSGAAPVAIIAPQTGTVIAANDAFAVRVAADAVLGRSLGGLLSFSHEQALRSVLDGESSELEQVQIVHAGGDERLSRVRIDRLELEHEAVLKLSLDEPRPADYLAMAIDQLGVALIVLDGDQRILAADRQARALFPDLAPDRAAASALAAGGAAADWWRIAPRRRLARTLSLGERKLAVEILRHRPYGADQALTFISLRGAGDSA